MRTSEWAINCAIVKASYPASPRRVPNVALKSCHLSPSIPAIRNAVLNPFLTSLELKREVFENRYDLRQTGTDKLADFIDNVFLPWSKLNKRSWRDDAYIATTLKEYFGGKTFREITPMLIEKFKGDRLKGITKKGTQRYPATVNREFDVLSKIFSLAIDSKKTDTNPCFKVKKLRVSNQRYRYLLPEEEPHLMAALDGPRAHLKAPCLQ